MTDDYKAELGIYKKLVNQQRLAWLILFISAVGTTIASEYVTITVSEGFVYILPVFIIFLVIVAMGQRIVFFKCPKCKKNMTTKYYLSHNPRTKECVHCGLSIFERKENRKITKKSTGDEWFQ